MPSTQILNQLRYKHWADQRTLAAISLIDEQAFPAELAFARQQLNHMVRVEEVFRARLTGMPEPHASTNTEILPALGELGNRLSDSNGWLQRYAAALSPEMLGEIIHFRFLDGKTGSMTREEILFHLVNHGSYHRGAIGRALDMAGGLRPADTYTVFVHAVEPERRGSA
jgi:uncharacterized damage-inducible protein DinB